MIRNYITIAFRNILRNKVYSFVNIAGLALGLTCFMVRFVRAGNGTGRGENQRNRNTKSIGILGFGIITLLTKEFMRLVLLGLLISAPLAFFAADYWLAGFAYHIEITWPVFAIAGISTLTIAFVTVYFESVKAALMNPIKSLRSD